MTCFNHFKCNCLDEEKSKADHGDSYFNTIKKLKEKEVGKSLSTSKHSCEFKNCPEDFIDRCSHGKSFCEAHLSPCECEVSEYLSLDEKGDAKQNNEKRGKLSLFNFY
jgi:hypothetical protein